jgi:hypothetical protein
MSGDCYSSESTTRYACGLEVDRTDADELRERLEAAGFAEDRGFRVDPEDGSIIASEEVMRALDRFERGEEPHGHYRSGAMR